MDATDFFDIVVAAPVTDRKTLSENSPHHGDRRGAMQRSNRTKWPTSRVSLAGASDEKLSQWEGRSDHYNQIHKIHFSFSARSLR